MLWFCTAIMRTHNNIQVVLNAIVPHIQYRTLEKTHAGKYFSFHNFMEVTAKCIENMN